MIIYIGYSNKEISVTASAYVMDAYRDQFDTITAWEVKTQGKKFNSWAKGVYIKGPKEEGK